MKQFIYVALIAFVVMTAGNVNAVIESTDHNLSSVGPSTMADRSSDEDQICIFCHTPHTAAASTGAEPLWNHTTNAAAGPYGVYSSATFDETGYSDIADIAAGGVNASLLCMSCHDGTIAVNSLYNESTVGTPTMGAGTELTGDVITSTANLGTDLSDDHPVNMTYFLSVNAPSEDPLQWNNTAAVSNDLLIGGKVQCASCHYAHGTTAGYTALLREDPAGSALCLRCHAK